MLAATVHLGSSNSEVTMLPYVFKRKNDGINIINLKKTWEKLMLAARAIAAIENPQDVFAVSCRNYGQRAVLKFARYTGSTAIAGRFTPGMNYSSPMFSSPGLSAFLLSRFISERRALHFQSKDPPPDVSDRRPLVDCGVQVSLMKA